MFFKLRLRASRSRSVCLLVCHPNKFSKRNFQTTFPYEISKQNLQKKFPKEISKRNFQTEFPNESSKSSFQTEKKLLVIFRSGLQTVIPLLIRGVMACGLRFWAVTHLIRYTLVRVTMARWSPITQYVVFYPNLLAVGGGTHDISAEIVHSPSFKERQMPEIQSD